MTLRDALVSLPDLDCEILDWLAAINSYKGVCTLNSCAGHTDKDDKGEPFVVICFLNGSSFYRFVRALSPVGSDASPVLTIFPDKRWMAVFPPLKYVDVEKRGVSPELLPSVRKELFEHVISTLERVVERKANEKEIELKIKVLKGRH